MLELILYVLHQVLNENLNPIWNQTFDFVVEDALHEMLILEVWDRDTFGKVCFCEISIQKQYYDLYFKLNLFLNGMGLMTRIY